MKKQLTFSIDTSKGYFWIILILIAFILFNNFSSPDVSKLQLENERLKTENEISALNERKLINSIETDKQKLKAYEAQNNSLLELLKLQKSKYKNIIIEKDEKKNTIDSYDRDAIIREFSKRYKQD